MKKILILVFLTGIVFLGCIQIEKDRYGCERDSDCVPEGCCHPTSCVNREFAPDCKGIFCTQECKSGTMDCGCGHCACVESKCTVEWTRKEEWC